MNHCGRPEHSVKFSSKPEPECNHMLLFASLKLQNHCLSKLTTQELFTTNILG